MAVFKRPVRPRSLRVFLIGMFAVPLVSLLALWGFALFLTIPGAIADHSYNVSARAFQNAAVTSLSIDLPAEQEQTYLWQLSDGKESKSALLAARAKITAALPDAEQTLQQAGGAQSATSRSDLSILEAALGGIPAIRQSVDNGTRPASAAFQAYSDIINDQYQLYYSEALERGGSLQGVTIGATDSRVWLERVSQELTLADGALAFDRGQLTPAPRQLFIVAASERELLMGQALSLMTPAMRAPYLAMENSAAYRQFETMESEIAASSGTLPVSLTAWDTDTRSVMKTMISAEGTDAAIITQLSGSASDDLVTKAVLAGGVGLAAVVVSVLLLVWFGRKVTRDLGELDSNVRDMAADRLPRVVDALRRGDDVDVRAESPAPDASGIEEISRIGRSFGIVQEAAVAAAVEQARLRKGVNQVFLNISMRNQSLLHRQLAMLDSMERRTSDPDALSDLFRLDHLTTRMRRHAEGLIILSGSTPGRAWRDPVPVVDVLRAAVAEIEDYVRVDVLSESRDLVAGNAVNDIVHLVAELVENAAVFSPPNTRIEVRADRVGTGLVAEIEDRGLGIGEEELAGINRRLASPPDFDPSSSEQLGLFVVSRLAARHSIRVSLRQSVYGGTTAILMVPFGVIVREEENVSLPRNDEWTVGRHRAPWEFARQAEGAAAPVPEPGQATSWIPAPVRELTPRHLGMPVRVPQASLAPQLRKQQEADQRAEARAVPSIDERSPETTKNMMIMMQQGWERGRSADVEDLPGADDNGPER